MPFTGHYQFSKFDFRLEKEIIPNDLKQHNSRLKMKSLGEQPISGRFMESSQHLAIFSKTIACRRTDSIRQKDEQ